MVANENFDDLVEDLIDTMRHLRARSWGANVAPPADPIVHRVVRPQDGEVLEVEQRPRRYRNTRVADLRVEFDCRIERGGVDQSYTMSLVRFRQPRRTNFDRVSIEIRAGEPLRARICINEQLLKIVSAG